MRSAQRPGAFAAASGLLVAVATLLSVYLVGAWDPTVARQRRRGVPQARARVRGRRRGAGARRPRDPDQRRRSAWVFGVVPVACLLAVARTAGACAGGCTAVGSRASAGTRCSRSARPSAVADLITRTRRDRRHGWSVTAACTSTGTGLILGVPVVGDLDAVATAARRGQHRIVSVGPGPGWTSARLHRLAWDIEEIGAEMVVDPSLVEVAGPRLRTAPVDGLPLLAVSRPTLGGAGWLAKAVADRVCAAVLLLVLAPLLLGLAFAIRSGGATRCTRRPASAAAGCRSRSCGSGRRCPTPRRA